MLTIDSLRAYGANVDEGLERCLGNNEFYIRLVKKSLDDKNFAALKDALDAKDLGKAFECAHALKGVAANLSLTPIFEPMSEMTELLRSRTDMDYSELYERSAAAIEELRKLCE